MLRESLSLGRLFGISIKLNWSVLVIFALIVVNLAVGVYPEWHPGWSPLLLWTVSLAAAVVFFLSLLAHELAHSLTAKAYGLPVRSITLFLFGGVSDIQEEPDTPWREIVIAGVGPLMSLVLGILFLWWFNLLMPVDAGGVDAQMQAFTELGPTASVLAWVGPINILLAVFNMIPALPLDGGRVFRAILWKATGDLKKATRWSAAVARLISWTLVGVGVAMIFGIEVPFLGSGFIGGLWLAVIGWFLGRSAMASYTQLLLDEALEGVQVSRLVREGGQTVPSSLSINTLIDDYLLEGDIERLPVVDGADYRGMVEFSDIHKVDQDDWSDTTITQVMTPADETDTAQLQDDVSDVLRTMLRHSRDQLPVLHDGEFRGMVHRDDILRWIQAHSDMNVPGVGSPTS
ncbi:site-2 protease family protein [Persicimonas caeni]|nr:site-2 protease family protein [Persicimonas caeni]